MEMCLHCDTCCQLNTGIYRVATGNHGCLLQQSLSAYSWYVIMCCQGLTYEGCSLCKEWSCSMHIYYESQWDYWVQCSSDSMGHGCCMITVS